MSKKCDNTSVGQLIYNKDGDLVLIERFNYPEAFALPAGHGDGMLLAEAAKKESLEEVGALILENKLVWSGKIDNPCKRAGGDHHVWEVYQAVSWSAHSAGSGQGELRAGSDAKKFFWCSPTGLRTKRTLTARVL